MTYLCGHHTPGVGFCNVESPRLQCPKHARATARLYADDGPDEGRHEYDDRSHYYQH